MEIGHECWSHVLLLLGEFQSSILIHQLPCHKLQSNEGNQQELHEKKKIKSMENGIFSMKRL